MKYSALEHYEQEHGKVKKDTRLDTKFGVVTVLNMQKGKIWVLIDNDITATFNIVEFFNDFAL